jgi:segregation and condensation protein A
VSEQDTQTDDSGVKLEVVEPPKAPELELAEGAAKQVEMPFAVVDGEPVTQLPQDLYIPPYALKVFLEAFEGPLDLLLYLIKRQNLDILNIPIAQITVQYTEYIELMRDMQLELAGDYLVMAAMLAEIKSRMLLPRPVSEEGEEEDPRAELIRRLQEYERYKQAASDLDALPRLERDHYVAEVEEPEGEVVEVLPDIELKELLHALSDVMRRAQMYTHHHVQKETLSVRERMGDVLSTLNNREFHDFAALFKPEEGRMGVVVTFLAILQLVKESLVELVQAEPYAAIHVKAAGAVEADGQAPDLDALEDQSDSHDSTNPDTDH